MDFIRLFHRRARDLAGSRVERGRTDRKRRFRLSASTFFLTSLASVAIAAGATLLIAGAVGDRDDGSAADTTMTLSRRDLVTSTVDSPAGPKSGDAAGDEQIPELPAPYVGSYAPPFELTDLAGRDVDLSELHGEGKAVLLNFWATWCPPCKEEMPELQRVHETMGDKVTIVGVDLGEPGSDVQAFIDEYGYDWTFLLDRDLDVAQAYRLPLRFIPTSYFIDPNGVIRSVFVGPMDLATIADRVDAAAAGRSVEG